MRFPTLLLLGFLVAGCTWEKPPSETLRFGQHALPVEVAASMAERRRGLMGRSELPEGQGMLFIFPTAGKKCMWMKNTEMPLSTAFIDAQGYILNVDQMQAESQDIHCSDGIASYAVEVNQGWFEKRGVRAGDQVSGLPPAP
ncbi:DUF192 domain-containing protein [Azomonas macrocytogenes]|uniref:DUF192 domain-containing protein n=1 Tax=Azomonas macrocytogenes TaxID=69962 RepID=A0A839T328_AZOMA|nr:DUF192 domain-containing protein [Azomonas macrocytogenes]MBB3102375.1 hypothetical protein [Azomonas macrocytogenes]